VNAVTVNAITTRPLLSADDAIAARRSVRAFLPDAVPQAMIEEILNVAGRAPSGNNAQPWKAYVVTGAAKERLTKALLAGFDDPDKTRYTADYSYYPKQWISPFLDRRRKVGWDLYNLLGLTRENKSGIAAQHRKNYEFFGAPVGLLFTLNKAMSLGSWLDYGMFLQSIMVAASARGLSTCAQAAFVEYSSVVRESLQISDEEIFVCGMALGWADDSQIENSLHTERVPAAEFAQFLS